MNWRVPLGFILAPIFPTMFIFGIIILAGSSVDSALVLFFSLTILVAQILGLILGWPLYLLIRRGGPFTLFRSIISAYFLTALIFSLPVLFLSKGHTESDLGGYVIINGVMTVHGFLQHLKTVTISSLYGAAIGFFFWLIAIRQSKKALKEDSLF